MNVLFWFFFFFMTIVNYFFQSIQINSISLYQYQKRKKKNHSGNIYETIWKWSTIQKLEMVFLMAKMYSKYNENLFYTGCFTELSTKSLTDIKDCSKSILCNFIFCILWITAIRYKSCKPWWCDYDNKFIKMCKLKNT